MIRILAVIIALVCAAPAFSQVKLPTGADPQNTVLIRHDACGQSQGTKVDLASAVKKPGSGEDGPELLGPEDVDARVDLGQLELLDRRIAGLDDLRQSPGSVPEILPRRPLTSLMMSPRYRSGTVISTSITGSRITGLASIAAFRIAWPPAS